eukprot:7245571-Prymnesium_polylepis.1
MELVEAQAAGAHADGRWRWAVSMSPTARSARSCITRRSPGTRSLRGPRRSWLWRWLETGYAGGRLPRLYARVSPRDARAPVRGCAHDVAFHYPRCTIALWGILSNADNAFKCAQTHHTTA